MIPLVIFNISNEHVVIELDELDRKVLFELAEDLQIAPCWDGINVHFIKEKSATDLRNYIILVWIQVMMCSFGRGESDRPGHVVLVLVP